MTILVKITRLPDERRKRDEDGRDPDAENHECSESFGAPSLRVLEGLGDGKVTVDTDGAEVQDGGGTHTHVTEHPDDAEYLVERPFI